MANFLTPELLDLLVQGLRLTILLTVITSLLSIGLGLFIGSLRLLGNRWFALPATVFVETFRNIPALILIIFWAFAFPNLFSPEVRNSLFFNNMLILGLADLTGLSVPWYVVASILGLTLNTSAYIAELFRAGVGTVAREHVDASKTMGASTIIIFRVILVPDGVRAAYPAISSRLIHNMKNTALVSFVAVPEFFYGILTAITRSFMAIEFLILAAMVYLALAVSMSFGLQRLEKFLYPRRKVPVT